jgi:hypothetical protein
MAEDPLALSTIPAAPPVKSDYDAICAAMMETERGRWFLTEYARRNRHADTAMVLAAIARIESVIRGEGPSPLSAQLRFELMAMAEAIARTKADIAAIKPDAGGDGKSDDEFAPAGHGMPTDVLAAAERVLDIVWALRDREVDPALCDALEAAAREIGTAVEHHDLAALRAVKAIQVLRHVEVRINALIDTLSEAPSDMRNVAADLDDADSGVPAQVYQDPPEPEFPHEIRSDVRDSFVFDLDPLPAAAPTETEARAEPEAASEPMALQPEPFPSPAAETEPAPAMADMPGDTEAPEDSEEPDLAADIAEIDERIADNEPPRPPDFRAETSIFLAKAPPHAFVVMQTMERDAADTADDVTFAPLPSEVPPDSEPAVASPIPEPEPIAELEPEPQSASGEVAADASVEFSIQQPEEVEAAVDVSVEPPPAEPQRGEEITNDGANNEQKEIHISQAVTTADLTESFTPNTEDISAQPAPDQAEPVFGRSEPAASPLEDVDLLLRPPPAPETPAPGAAFAESDEDPAADLFEFFSEPRPAISQPPEAARTAATAADLAQSPAAARELAIGPEATAAAHGLNAATAAGPIATAAPIMPEATTPAPAPPRFAPQPIRTPRPTPNDPMAAVRALSEEELIALFS